MIQTYKPHPARSFRLPRSSQSCSDLQRSWSLSPLHASFFIIGAANSRRVSLRRSGEEPWPMLITSRIRQVREGLKDNRTLNKCRCCSLWRFYRDVRGLRNLRGAVGNEGDHLLYHDLLQMEWVASGPDVIVSGRSIVTTRRVKRKGDRETR